MTPRQRMLTAMTGGQPDCVPVAPDTSNMIPCRLTGKPSWDIYLYHDPPLWEAYIDCVKHFGFDGWLHNVPVQLDHEREAAAAGPAWRQAIVLRTDERIVTRMHATVDGRRQWSDTCTVYYIADPPTSGVAPETVGLPAEPPTHWEDVSRRRHYSGLEAYDAARERMGDDGVIGMSVHLPGLNVRDVQGIYAYYDDRDAVLERCRRQHEAIMRRVRAILAMAPRPDFVLIGVSGHMIANPEPIFRGLSLPALKDITATCKQAGMPTQIHCCGPEYDLVKIAALESDLDSINPLEHPPMGDCDLAQVKREFGDRISLMGNLHTTDIMLRGTVEDVRAAARKAIDAAAAGGAFILSTGDQCGRDTPDANLHAMIDVARTYGRY